MQLYSARKLNHTLGISLATLEIRLTRCPADPNLPPAGEGAQGGVGLLGGVIVFDLSGRKAM